MKRKSNKNFMIKPLSKVITAAIISMSSSQVLSANFNLGNVDITFDSTFSLGTSIRVENRNFEGGVGISNNPNNGFDFEGYNPNTTTLTSADIFRGEGNNSTNGDNGNLNYDAGDAFSTIFKGSHDLDIRYENYGFFARALYFYDTELSDNSRAYTNPVSGVTNDPCRDSEASEQLCKDIRLLDAYFYADFDIGDKPLTVKIGQQVISWGESSFIAHGISELNPVDVARLRAPGSELKEAFIPYGAVWGSLGLSENLTIEAFYQYDWEATVLPAPGSYFSNNDFAGDGGQFNNVQLGFGGRPDLDLDGLITQLNEIGNSVRTGEITTTEAISLYLTYPAIVSLRAPGSLAENEPDDGGQYGVRFSWYLPELNDTEISAYYLNYHSRRPIFSGITADFTSDAITADITQLASSVITQENYTDLDVFSRVELDYVEDIQLYALSFNTAIGETSVAGEVSYRQDEPLQIDDVELLFAAVPQQLANNIPGQEALDGISQIESLGPGERIQGFVLSDTVQAQITLTHLFGPTLGASQFTGLIEVGGISIRDLPDADVLRLNGPGTDRNGGIAGREGLEIAIQDGVETNPFPNSFSWGYRVVAKLDYNNVFAGINVSPRIVFSHDVSGTTPDPLFLFVEERKSVAIGVSLDYQNRWGANFSYNGFFDGVGTTNRTEDRDFVSLSISYSI